MTKTIVYTDSGSIKAIHHGMVADDAAALPSRNKLEVADADFPEDFSSSGYEVSDGSLVQV
jgi:hypothetical protein